MSAIFILCKITIFEFSAICNIIIVIGIYYFCLLLKQMQTVNILTRYGTSFPLNLTENTVIRSGFSHTLTLQLKYNGSGYLIQKAELTPHRNPRRPNRFLEEASINCINFIFLN